MQIVEGHDTCSYCDYPFEVYTTHYFSECPANRTERRKLLTDGMLNITDSHKTATAILNSQARTGHIKRMQLIRKYPVITGKKTKEVHNSKPGSNHAPETQNGVSNHQTTTIK